MPSTAVSVNGSLSPAAQARRRTRGGPRCTCGSRPPTAARGRRPWRRSASTATTSSSICSTMSVARSTMSPRSASIAGSSSSTRRKSASASRSVVGGGADRPAARAAQARSPIWLTASLEAKNSAQIQNTAKPTHDDGEHAAPRAEAAPRRRRSVAASASRSRLTIALAAVGSRRRAGRSPPPTPSTPAITAPIQPSHAVQSRPMAWSRLHSPGPDRGDRPGDDGDRRRMYSQPWPLKMKKPIFRWAVQLATTITPIIPAAANGVSSPSGEQQPGADLGAAASAGLQRAASACRSTRTTGRAGEAARRRTPCCSRGRRGTARTRRAARAARGSIWSTARDATELVASEALAGRHVGDRARAAPVETLPWDPRRLDAPVRARCAEGCRMVAGDGAPAPAAVRHRRHRRRRLRPVHRAVERRRAAGSSTT